MEHHEWLVFTCRACRGVIKLSPVMGGKQVICPHCRTKVTVPKDAAIIQEPMKPAHLPATRDPDEMMSQLRGHGREEWEIGGKRTGGDIEFRQRLHSTNEPELKPDPDRALRRRKKHRRISRGESDFDEPGERHRSRRRAVHSRRQAFVQTFVRGLVAAVVILAAVVAWLVWDRWRKPKPAPQHKAEYVQQDPLAGKKETGGPPLERRSVMEYGPALREAIERFTKAPDLEAMLPLVRDRARVEPKIRAYYTAENPWKPIEINNKFDPDDIVQVEGDFIIVQLVLANYSRIPLSFERKGIEFLADWESFTGHGDMSWAELMKQRPEKPVLMRVVIERSASTEYFNGPFNNHTTHNCFLLRDLDSQYILSGYTLKDSAADIRIRQYLQPAPAPANGMARTMAVLRFRYPPASTGPHQVEITEFIANGWVFRPRD